MNANWTAERSGQVFRVLVERIEVQQEEPGGRVLTERRSVYEQTVPSLDLLAVIRAVNGMTVPLGQERARGDG